MALPARTADFERTYTSDEFERLPQFNERYELIDRRLIEKPMPNYEHGRVVQRLNRAITLFDPAEKLGEIAQEVSTRTGPRTAPLPDLSFGKQIASRLDLKGRLPDPI
jgi:Uma2 family endonuclease